MKNLCIINSENIEIIEAIKKYFENKDVEITIKEKSEEIRDFDLVVLTGYDSDYKYSGEVPVLNIHPALLPAFASGEAIQNTFISGVKVSGVTVHKVEKDNFYGKILAQYPVLIGNTTHLDEFCSELIVIAKSLYPVVIDAVLNDRVFDFQDLLTHRSACSGHCSGQCSGCGNH